MAKEPEYDPNDRHDYGDFSSSYPHDHGIPWDYGEELSAAMASLPPPSGGNGNLPGRGGDEVSIEELLDPDDHRPADGGARSGGTSGKSGGDGPKEFPLDPGEYNYFDFDGKPVWQQGLMVPQMHNGKEWVSIGLGKVLMEGKKIDKAEFDRLVADAAGTE